MIRYIRRASERNGRAGLFLDRDGVLNARRPNGYVIHPSQLTPLDTAIPAIRAAAGAGAALVIVTNQGCIGRGLADDLQVLEVNSVLLRWLEARGVSVDAVYVCPHHPEAIRPEDRRCGCRKPQPGLVLQAAADLGLDLDGSALIGDALSDLEAARAAGSAPAGCFLLPELGPTSGAALEAGVAAFFA